MGHLKRAQLEFQGFPDSMILDFEDIFWRLRADVTRIYQKDVDWDLFFSIIMDGVCQLDRYLFDSPFRKDHHSLVEQALEIANGDQVFPDLYDAVKMEALYRVIYRAGLEMKERLMALVAYHMGVFPYTFRTMISDGCLFFSKNESIYDPRVFDSGF